MKISLPIYVDEEYEISSSLKVGQHESIVCQLECEAALPRMPTHRHMLQMSAQTNNEVHPISQHFVLLLKQCVVEHNG